MTHRRPSASHKGGPQWAPGLSDTAEVESLLGDLATELGEDKGSPQDERARARELSSPDWTNEQVFNAFRTAAWSITGNLDLQTLAKQILVTTIQALGAERGILFLGRSGSAELAPVVALNVKGEELDELERVSITIVNRGRAGEVLISQDATKDPLLRDIPSVPLKAIRSVLCAPLVVRGKTIGVVYLDAPSTAWSFPSHIKRFLEAFAGLAAMALENARLHGDAMAEVRRLRDLTGREPFDSLVTLNPVMESLLHKAANVAQANAPVLLLGESGTGKELLARAIHQASPRADRRFVAYNCAATPKELMESVFFGHVRGAFTGALGAAPGLFREAHGGVLFLDEIAELDSNMQAKLFRVFDSGVVRPVGSDRDFKVDVRLITATSRSLGANIRRHRFRKELYYRISVLVLRIPPLRKRPEDIPALVSHFVHKHADDRIPRRDVCFTPDALEYFQQLRWPGNVRQLENLVRRILVCSNRARVDRRALKRLMPHGKPAGAGATPPHSSSERQDKSKASHFAPMNEREREAIQEALARCNGHQSKAAELLGIHRNSLSRKMQRLGISRHAGQR